MTRLSFGWEVTALLVLAILAFVALFHCLSSQAAAHPHTTLAEIRQCESEGNYKAANLNDWHVWWPGYGSHWRLSSFGAYQFGWGRWHSAAHRAGEHEHAHTRPDRVPPAIQDAVAEWQYNNDPTVWSCYK